MLWGPLLSFHTRLTEITENENTEPLRIKRSTYKNPGPLRPTDTQNEEELPVAVTGTETKTVTRAGGHSTSVTFSHRPMGGRFSMGIEKLKAPSLFRG